MKFEVKCRFLVRFVSEFKKGGLGISVGKLGSNFWT